MIDRVYIFQNKLSEDLVQVFDNLYQKSSIEYYNNSIMIINIYDYANSEIDYNMLQSTIMSDFNTDTSLVYINTKVFKYLPEDYIFENISQLKNKAYNITKFLLYMIYTNYNKNDLKYNLLDLLGQEYIDIALMIAKNNMNFSISAKKLYMHRNSLSYRIRKIYEKTSIDIRTFSGLSVFTSLFEI